MQKLRRFKIASSAKSIRPSDSEPEFSVGSGSAIGARGILSFTQGGLDDGDSVVIDISNDDYTNTLLITILGANFFDDAGALIPANIASGSSNIIAAIDFHPVSGEGAAITVDLTDISLTRSDPVAPEPASLALLMIGMVGVSASAAKRQLGRRKC